MRRVSLIAILFSAFLIADSNSQTDTGSKTVVGLTQAKSNNESFTRLKNKMDESFSDQVKQVLFFSRYEAAVSNTSCIESYHLLLGLMRVDSSVIGNLLSRPSATSRNLVRKKVQEKGLTGTTTREVKGSLPFSAESQRILRSSLAIGRSLSEESVETKHLLVAIMWEESSVAAQVLSELGLSLNKIYSEFNLPASLIEVHSKLKAQEMKDQSLWSLTDQDIKLLKQLLISPPP